MQKKKKKGRDEKKIQRERASPPGICRRFGFRKRPRTRIERSRQFAASTARTGDCSFPLTKGNQDQLRV